MTMRVVECNICGEPLTAASDEELARRLREHTEAEHSTAQFDDEQALAMVAAEAYDASDS